MSRQPLFIMNPNLSGAYKKRPRTTKECIPNVPAQDAVLQRHVGIEIEVEHCGDFAWGDFSGMRAWVSERDGSLRGDDAREFKTRFPSTCEDGVLALRSFFKMVSHIRDASSKEYFLFSERTSIHIHVDVRDLYIEQIKAAAKLYMIFEKSFFDFIGRERYHNIFCIPLAESQILDVPQGNRWMNNWEKYSALNMAPINNFGTIEFRGMAGNDNCEHIVAWLMMVTALVQFAQEHSPEAVDEMINELKTESQYQLLADRIMGTDLSRLLTMFPEASDSAASMSKFL